MTNNTEGWTWSQNLTYSSSLDSTEWIMEATTVNGNLSPLPNYGSAPFSEILANGAMPILSLSDGYTMQDSSGGYSTPCAPNNQEFNQFLVDYGSSCASSSVPSKDIWTTSVYSYCCGGGGPGGGLADENLKLGGWGDLYYPLIKFDLSNLPKTATHAQLRLYSMSAGGGTPTALNLYKITQYWNWQTQGTGEDRLRLWWADQPSTALINGSLPAPAVNSYYYIDITDLYNAWQAGSIPNYGIELRPTQNNNNFDFFASSRHSNPAWWPTLLIDEEFTAVPTSGPTPLAVTFTASALPLPMTYTVDFGDGTTGALTQSSCIGVAAIVGGHGGIQCSGSASHTYTAAGSYSATLLNALGLTVGTVAITVTGAVPKVSIVPPNKATTLGSQTIPALQDVARQTLEAPFAGSNATVPTISSFTASPASISPFAGGSSATLSWTVASATSLSISGLGAVIGNSVQVSPSQTTTYTLTASNAQGAVTAQTTVTVSGYRSRRADPLSR